jgi:hypothetical protein
MMGLASKSTTTWFLGGRSTFNFIKFHFESVGIVQLAYTASNNANFGLSWYINTAYVMQASFSGSVC